MAIISLFMSRSLLCLPLVVGGVLCLGGAAQAQMQEEKVNRILHPDMNKSFDTSIQKKFGSSSFNNNTNGRVIEMKTVSESRKFNIKSFLTGKFSNDKSFWMGDFKYDLGNSKTLSRSFALPESFLTNAAPVKRAQGIDKHYDAASVATRDYRGTERNKMRAHLTQQQAAQNGYDGELKELKSIDDVRSLLNKSK